MTEKRRPKNISVEPSPPDGRAEKPEFGPEVRSSHFESVIEFVDHIRPEKWPPTWVFRGQTNSNWKLEPAAMRQYALGIPSEHTPGPERESANYNLWRHLVYEWRAVYEFAVAADRIGLDAQLSEEAHQFDREICSNRYMQVAGQTEFPPGKLLDLFSLAQHHGVPTRLLDWSSNPLIAAFFAARGVILNKVSGSFAVWALDTRSVKSTGLGAEDLGLEPAPLRYFTTSYHRQSFQRAQRGGFTIDCESASYFLKNGNWRPHCAAVENWQRRVDGAPTAHYLPRKPLVKFTAPAHVAHELLRILSRYDITLIDLMPSLDNVARMLWPQLSRDS